MFSMKIAMTEIYTFEHLCQVELCTNCLRLGVLKGIWYQPGLPTLKGRNEFAENHELHLLQMADDYCKRPECFDYPCMHPKKETS